eukprot:6264702-Prymnesium_polylepis.1
MRGGPCPCTHAPAPALQRRATREHAPCRTHRPHPAPRPDPGTSTTPQGRGRTSPPHDRYSLVRVNLLDRRSYLRGTRGILPPGS